MSSAFPRERAYLLRISSSQSSSSSSSQSSSSRVHHRLRSSRTHDAPSSPRAFVHGLAREALARLLLDAPDGVFKDRRSGFAFAQDYPLGPREAEGGDAPPFSLAESRQKMAADWVLMMHVAAARLPAPFSELTGLLGDAGWTAPNDAWQEVVRGLFSDEVLSVSQNKAGDIYEVWF